MEKNLRIIAIFAHPDDGDVKMGATAAMLANAGHHTKFVSLTNGDAGHHEKSGDQLSQCRRSEALAAAERLGIDEYTVWDYHDGELQPNLPARRGVIREIRKWNADVVIGLRPWDYHPDHRYAEILLQDAAYTVQVLSNIVPDTSPLDKNPIFLYMQDEFQNPYPFSHDIVIGVDSHIHRKIDALDAHKSQMYEWLAWVEDRIDEVPETNAERKTGWLPDGFHRLYLVNRGKNCWKNMAKKKETNFKYAESFEICEYGSQPEPDFIRKIFPMLLES